MTRGGAIQSETEVTVPFRSDLDGALEGKKFIIEPNSPSPGLVGTFTEVNGAPVEVMQFAKSGRGC